ATRRCWSAAQPAGPRSPRCSTECPRARTRCGSAARPALARSASTAARSRSWTGEGPMFGIDNQIASLGNGQTFLIVAAVAILLGLRHATDPDHLTAVSTLIAGEGTSGVRRAGKLGFAWGLGHATS